MNKSISQHVALIYTMVIMSAADRDMTDRELGIIGETVRVLPVFDDYDITALPDTARSCADLLEREDGLETVLGLIRNSLSEHLRETAYALACEVAAADGHLSQEEMRLLEMIRHRLDIERLHAAAIERAVAARFRTH